MIIETYKDEINNEEYYIDSSTVENLNIKKAQIDIRDYGKRKVSLNVKYIPLKKGIKIISSISIDNKNYSGESQMIDSLTFSNALAQAIMKDEQVENTLLISTMIDQALSSLSISMMNDSVVIKDHTFSGVGYITSKNKKIAIFEEMSLSSEHSDSGVNSVLIKKCVNSFDLSLAESCSLEFCSNNFVVSADIRTTTKVDTKRISSYHFSVFNIKISKDSKPVEVLENIENDIDKFVDNRLSLLDDIVDSLNVDELFEDMF